MTKQGKTLPPLPPLVKGGKTVFLPPLKGGGRGGKYSLVLAYAVCLLVACGPLAQMLLPVVAQPFQAVKTQAKKLVLPAGTAKTKAPKPPQLARAVTDLWETPASFKFVCDAPSAPAVWSCANASWLEPLETTSICCQAQPPPLPPSCGPPA